MWPMWIAVLLACAVFALSAAAEVQVGISHSIADSERVKAATGYHVNAGRSVYVWGSYETPDVQLVGQSLGDVELIGAGLGLRSEGRLRWFAEFGYFDASASTVDGIRDEAVWTQLKSDHGTPTWHPAHTVYALEDGYGGRLGASYAIRQRFLVSLAYRALKLDEGYDACTGADPTCDYPVDGRHWQNRKTLDLSAVEFGLRVRF